MKAKTAFFLACLGLALMIISLYGIFVSKDNNEMTMGLVGFVLTGVLTLVAILDYDYLTKKEQL